MVNTVVPNINNTWRTQSISATAIEVKLLPWENIIHT